MHARRLGFGLALVIVAGALSGCGLIEDIFGGLADLCDADPLVVTKTADTDDALCTSDDCSLREAILTANSCPGRQNIEIPAGTYNLTISGADEDEAHTGDLDVLDSLSLTATGGEVIIDAGGIDRAFQIHDEYEAGPDPTIFQGLTIQGGHADFTGGGVYLEQGWLSLVDVTIRNNQAGFEGTAGGAGGGIYADDNLTTSRTRIEGNSALGPGGGLYLSENAYLLANDAMVVTGNTAEGGEGGGGIFSRTEAHFIGEISDNETPGNGAGFWNGGDLEIRGAELTGNSGALNGGGLFNAAGASAIVYSGWFNNNNAGLGGGVYNQGLVHLYDSAVNTNTAFDGFGGGAYNDGVPAALLIRNTTFSGNMVTPPGAGGGSGIYNNEGDMQLEFATFAYNNADGVMNDGGHGVFESTIMAYHADGNCSGDPLNSNGYNLTDDSTCDLIEDSDLPDTDPLLGPLALNGGTNLNHLPQPGSPAIDSGDRDTCLEHDQRMVSRPQGDRCDRGSIEVAPGDGGTGGAVPTPLARLININFNADRYTIESGECTTLRWAVTCADRIDLLGQEREATEAQRVCPDQTTGYTLLAENDSEQDSAFLQIEVTKPQDNGPKQGCLVYDAQTQKDVCQVPCQQPNPEQYPVCSP